MKAISIGGAMVDTIAIIESDRIERMSMLNAETSFLLLEEGRKTEALDVSTHCGGGAINTAVAMSRLGLDVSTLVKLGRDARADFILARLSAEGISTRWVIRDAKAPTGASVIISSHDRNAAVFTFRGANTLLEPSDLADDAFAVDLVYVSNLSNQSADCYPHIIEKAKAAGALVAVNAGLRQLSVRGGTFLDSLGRIDILALNRARSRFAGPGLVAKFGEGGPTLALDAGEQPPPLLARGLVGGGFEIEPSCIPACRAQARHELRHANRRPRRRIRLRQRQRTVLPGRRSHRRQYHRRRRRHGFDVCRPHRSGPPGRRCTQGRDFQCGQRCRAHRYAKRPFTARCARRTSRRTLRTSDTQMADCKGDLVMRICEAVK